MSSKEIKEKMVREMLGPSGNYAVTSDTPAGRFCELLDQFADAKFEELFQEKLKGLLEIVEQLEESENLHA